MMHERADIQARTLFTVYKQHLNHIEMETDFFGRNVSNEFYDSIFELTNVHFQVELLRTKLMS